MKISPLPLAEFRESGFSLYGWCRWRMPGDILFEPIAAECRYCGNRLKRRICLFCKIFFCLYSDASSSTGTVSRLVKTRLRVYSCPDS